MGFNKAASHVLILFTIIHITIYFAEADRNTQATRNTRKIKSKSVPAYPAVVASSDLNAIPRSKRQLELLAGTGACSDLCHPSQIAITGHACATLCGGVSGPISIGKFAYGPRSSYLVDGRIGFVDAALKYNCECSNEPMNKLCGWDNTEHDNECYAACFGTVPKYYGECSRKKDAELWEAVYEAGSIDSMEHYSVEDDSEEDCGCLYVEYPVCGTDKQNYTNRCIAQCKGALINNEGPCRSGTFLPFWSGIFNPFKTGRTVCPCPLTYWPVCGVDGKKYRNKCILKCAGVPLAWTVHQEDGTRECYKTYE